MTPKDIRVCLLAAYPPADDTAPHPSRNIREAIEQLDREATRLAEAARRHPIHETLGNLVENMR